MPLLRWVAFVLTGLCAVAAVTAGFAPAGLAHVAVSRATLGRLGLAEADGTVWRGSGRLVLVDVASAADGSARREVLPGVAIPGRIAWDIRALPLLLGLVEANVRIDGMAAPVRVAGQLGRVEVGPGAFSLPSVELGQLGSPWNTIKPAGALSVKWEALTLRQGTFDGRADIELRDASSALTPVRPLGSYRLRVVGGGQKADLSIETIDGPLRLSGNGTWDARAGARFTATATADAAERSRLNAFLGLIGRRDGDATQIRIGS